MIKGCDTSSAQGKLWSPPAGFDFVYVKATEGTSYVNPYHDDQVARSRDKGLVVGHYAVAREGHKAADMVDYFLTHAKAKPGDFLIWDWEQWQVGGQWIIVPCSTKDALIKQTQKAAGLMTGLYCNVDAWLHEDTTSFAGDLLAIADYSVAAGDPRITHPWQIHQYSNGGGLDKNVGIWPTRQAMKDWALGRAPLVRWAPVHGDAAIKAAKAWIGKPYPVGACQKFTNELFQTGTVGDFDHDNDFDAVDGWEAAVAKGKVVPASRIKSMDDVPGAAMAYWSGGSKGYGHAAPTIGQGDIVSTDLTGNKYTPGVVGRAPLTAPHDVWGHTFLGYAVVEGNGYTLLDTTTRPVVVTPPEPIKENFDMAEPIEWTRSKPQGFNKVNSYDWLYLDNDNKVSFVGDPGLIVGGVLDLVIDGLAPDDSIYIYPGAFDVTPGVKSVMRANESAHPLRIPGSPAGLVRGRFPFKTWTLGSEAKGFHYRALRFRVKSSTTNAKITRLTTSAAFIKH